MNNLLKATKILLLSLLMYNYEIILLSAETSAVSSMPFLWQYKYLQDKHSILILAEDIILDYRSTVMRIDCTSIYIRNGQRTIIMEIIGMNMGVIIKTA